MVSRPLLFHPPSFQACGRGYLRECSGSRRSLSPSPRDAAKDAAPAGVPRADRSQPCCSGPDRTICGTPAGGNAQGGPSTSGGGGLCLSSVPDPRAGVPLGTLQDGGPHDAVWDAPGSENIRVSPFPGRLVAAAALELQLH